METLNGRDLAKDFMRIDQPNVMTRPINVLQNVNVVKLIMNQTVALHGVQLELWFKKAVRKSGNFTIVGKKSLRETQLLGGVA